MEGIPSTWTIAQVKEKLTSYGITPLGNLRKDRLIAFANAALYEKSVGLYNPSPEIILNANSVNEVYMDDGIPWLDHLNQKGWCVVPIPNYENYIENFFTWMETHGEGFSRYDMSTWKTQNLPPSTRGIFKQHIGQEPWIWKIRESCASIFAQLYGCQERDLLCSYDGGCFLPQSKQIDTFKSWFHNDTPRGNTQICAQGIVNLVANHPKDGGLLLAENSHHLFDTYMQKYPSYGYSWSKANMNDSMFSNTRLIHICAPAGTITLFNGKTFHANYSGNNGPSPYRMCVYVSMAPRSYSLQEEIQNHVRWYEKGEMTGHWTYGPYFQVNSVGRYGKKNPNIPMQEPTQLQKRLIGY